MFLVMITADLVQRYGESVSYDWRLFRQDIAGSIAHARAQLKAGLLSQEEFSAIESGLKDILKDIEAGNFSWSGELENVHMNIESELTRRIGAPGAKLHTARSRKDQVATDTRLYLSLIHIYKGVHLHVMPFKLRRGRNRRQRR